jgi:hypothetical protein
MGIACCQDIDTSLETDFSTYHAGPTNQEETAARKDKVPRTKYKVMGAAARRADEMFLCPAQRISSVRRVATGMTLYFVLGTLYFS